MEEFARVRAREPGLGQTVGQVMRLGIALRSHVPQPLRPHRRQIRARAQRAKRFV